MTAVSNWSDLKQYDDEHDYEYFAEENERFGKCHDQFGDFSNNIQFMF